MSTGKNSSAPCPPALDRLALINAERSAAGHGPLPPLTVIAPADAHAYTHKPPLVRNEASRYLKAISAIFRHGTRLNSPDSIAGRRRTRSRPG